MCNILTSAEVSFFEAHVRVMLHDATQARSVVARHMTAVARHVIQVEVTHAQQRQLLIAALWRAVAAAYTLPHRVLRRRLDLVRVDATGAVPRDVGDVTALRRADGGQVMLLEAAHEVDAGVEARR